MRERRISLTARLVVFLCFVLSSSLGQGFDPRNPDLLLSSISVPLSYGAAGASGAWSPPLCLGEETQYFDSYELSQSVPYTFVQTFFDQLPDDTKLVALNVTLLGRFQCDNTSPAILLTLNDDLFAAGLVSDSLSGCNCPNCAQPLQLPSTTQNAPVYHYRDNNTFTVRVIQGRISLSQAVLTFTFTTVPPAPPVTSLLPTSGSVEGGTLVSLVSDAGGIDNATTWCLFGTHVVLADYVDDSTVLCRAPASFAGRAGKSAVTVTQNNISYSTPFPYYYYKPFTILSGENLDGPTVGGTPVSLEGRDILDEPLLQLMACKFGDLPPFKADFANSTFVLCLSPEFQLNKSATHEVPIFLAQNGVDYAPTNKSFTYVLQPVDSGRRFPLWEWALVGIVFVLLLLLLVGGTVFIVKKFRHNRANQGFSNSSSGSKSSGSEQRSPLLHRSGPAEQRLIANAYGSTSSVVQLPASFNNIDLSQIQDLKLIEKGSFGLIYKGVWEGTTIAVKKLPAGKMTSAFIEELEQEAGIMRQLRHPNVLNFLGTSCDMDGHQICIIMEYMDRGSLYRLIHDESIQFTIEQIRTICIDAARGVNYLHNLNPPIIHRDIKSHNFLMNAQGIVKVCDFGLSRFIETTLAGTMTACGTPSWTAPEVLRNERYNFKVDVFSFGIVIWELFSRQDPYPGMPPFQIVFAVGNQFARPQINPSWPAHWIRLMTSCWAEDPESRPTFEQVLNILQSNFSSTSSSSFSTMDPVYSISP